MKRWGLLLILLLMAALLAACGAKDDGAAKALPACADVAAAVEAGQTFEEMTALKGEQILKYLDLDEALATDLAMSMDASRATAEMIIVITAADDAALSQVQEALQVYRAVTLEQYKDYRPEEAPKLEAAVAKTNGMQTVLIVSPDAQAAETALDTAWK